MLSSANSCLNRAFHTFLRLLVGLAIVRTEASSYQYYLNRFNFAKEHAISRLQKIVNWT